ncbi:alpha/beta hydrolase [Bacillus sp. B15-48]|uniref:alpha/beta fold hydrolase n=1 Tax=Bacillus sp. B15-48 TaxID=1548601 RepID=UPI00193F5833|nr:alpha/beta hydrolase [Bacillus sp. B15-48]MBM4760704.1 alpha/beta fold hydrolase [Bacillus sp. B15-48]
MEQSHFSESKQINGIDVYYEYFKHPSSEKTVVLLHGFLSSLFSFRHLVPLLKQNYSVFSVDLPPFGKSGHSRNYHYSYKNIALTVVSLLDVLGIKNYSIIGHSMGGQIALNVLYHHPHRAKKTVLLSSSGYLSRAKQLHIFASYLPFFHLLVKNYLARSGIEKNLRNVVYNHSLIDNEMREGYLSPFLDNSIFKGLTGMLRHREGDLTSVQLQKVQTPCLLLWGRHDRVVPLNTGRKLVEDLPNSQLIVLEDTGHLLPEERPEDVCQHINHFLMDGERF